VTYAAFSADGRRVVTASFDGIARVWDAATGAPVTPPLQHYGPLLRAAFSPDGRLVVTISKDGTTRAWDMAAGHPVTSPLRHRGGVIHAAFSPNGHHVLTVTRDAAQVWDAATGEPITPALRRPGYVPHHAFSPDGRCVVTASHDGTARVWDMATGRAITPPLRHHRAVSDAAFSPDGRRVVTASSDGTARVWDATTGKPVTPPLRHGGEVTYAAFSPDSRRIVTVCSDQTVRVWNAATGTPVTPSLPQYGPVEDAVFSPDGRHLLTTNFDRVHGRDTFGSSVPWSKQLEFWDYLMLKHSERVWHAAYSPDGRRVVTACADQTARVWSPLTPPLQHRGEVRYAAFSPDGSRIVTASDDQTARVWDAATGEPLSPPLRHHGKVLHAEFSPDGRQVVTASEDQTAQVWDLPVDDRPCPDVQRLAQLLSGRRIDSNSGSVLFWAVGTDWEPLRGQYPGDFTTTRRQVLAWHQCEAEDAERVREWAAALPHLDCLVKAKPKQASHRVERAGVHAELGHWNRATADLTAALALRPEDPQVWSYDALTQLAGGDTHGYRKTCAEMLHRFGGTDDPEVANTVARTFAQIPGAVTDPARPVRLAETALRFGHRWTLGEALYRAGRLDAAMKRLTDASVVQGGESRGSGRLFLAMCHARLGHPVEARQWLQRAVQWIEQATNRKSEQGAPLPWDQRVELHLLRGEAEAVLEQTAIGQRSAISQKEGRERNSNRQRG
jgi:WD40 repeat protein